jgi:hypothetical protein
MSKRTKKSEEGPVLPFQIEAPEDTEFTNAIIYGDTGSGKTFLLGTANDCEDATPMLLIDVDGGTKSLRGRKIDIVRPGSWKDLQDIYNFLRHDNHQYRSVGIDSLTEFQKKFSMGTILGDIKVSKEGDTEYSDLGETTVPTRQDWMKTGDQMRKLIRAFKDLAYLKSGGDRVHVFMTCLEKIEEKRQLVGPMFSGQLSVESGAYVDVLARLSNHAVKEEEEGEEKVTNRRHLLVDVYENAEGVKYLAKNRGSSVKSLWEPTIKKIIHLRDEG